MFHFQQLRSTRKFPRDPKEKILSKKIKSKQNLYSKLSKSEFLRDSDIDNGVKSQNWLVF